MIKVINKIRLERARRDADAKRDHFSWFASGILESYGDDMADWPSPAPIDFQMKRRDMHRAFDRVRVLEARV